MFKGDGFDSLDKKGIAEQFQIEETELDGCNILYANYSLGCYEGSALVVFQKEGKLYEVNASHCSCFGLEQQWSPEETTRESLLTRPSFYMSDYDGDVVEDLKKALTNV